jgi:hypothetical protein
MNIIDSDIYTIHLAYEYLRNAKRKKIPASITYEQWCKQLRESHGVIYMKPNAKSEMEYCVRYNAACDNMSIPNEDSSEYEIGDKSRIYAFLGLHTQIPQKDFQSYKLFNKEYGGCIMLKHTKYSISYDYMTDEDVDEYDLDHLDATKSVTLPVV